MASTSTEIHTSTGGPVQNSNEGDSRPQRESGERQYFGYERGRGSRGGWRGRGAGRGNSGWGRRFGGSSRGMSDGGGGRRGGRGRGGSRSGAGAEATAQNGSQNMEQLSQQLQQTTIVDESEKTDEPSVNGTEGTGVGNGPADESICFICANPVIYYSIAPCGHSTCHICSLRMRALYGNKACAHCRTESEFVIFASDEERKYEQYRDEDIVRTDSNLGIRYATAAIHDDTVLLLQYNCPDPSCDIACLGWKNLHSHVKNAHDRVLCRLCTRNKKVFTHEHQLFTYTELKRHERHGDDIPGSTEQSGFKGHPECGFCLQRYYSSDELYNHCREAHERCFICDRQNFSQNHQYYLNYDALVVHFQKDHFMCLEKECLEKKFIVFASDIDLRAHQLEAHPEGLSKSAKKDARRIDISQFEGLRTPQEGRGQGRGRGRGRDPNAELPPARSEQPLRRDELAYQRTLAVQSSQSTSTRTFGGQLTNPSGPAFAAQPPAAQAQRPLETQTAVVPQPRAPVPAQAPLPAVISQFPPLGTSQAPALNGSPASTQSKPQSTPVPRQLVTPQSSQHSQPTADEQKKARHQLVVDKATALFKNDATKLDIFRRYVSEYRAGIQTAREVCDSFWSLFDTTTSELGSLIRALAELYEDETKRRDLLTAWNSWKTMNEDYPPFAGTSSSASDASRGSRVLRIKSSTAGSARSAGQGAWGSAAAPSRTIASTQSVQTAASRLAASNLTSSSASPRPAASGPQPNQASRQLQPTPTPVTYANPKTASPPTSKAPSEADFPSLPPKKPLHNFGPVIRPGGGRGIVVNAWMANSQQQASQSGANGGDAAEDEGESSTGKKKKGKQKQTLFHFG